MESSLLGMVKKFLGNTFRECMCYYALGEASKRTIEHPAN